MQPEEARSLLGLHLPRVPLRWKSQSELAAAGELCRVSTVSLELLQVLRTEGGVSEVVTRELRSE